MLFNVSSFIIYFLKNKMFIKSSTATLVTVFCLIGLARCASIGHDKMAKAQSLGLPIITDKAAAESDYDLQAVNSSLMSNWVLVLSKPS